MNFYTYLTKQSTGETHVLATIIKTRGSTPQVMGASALFSQKGLIHGTIGGGILESTITKLAIESCSTGVSRLVEFDLDGNISDESGAICGGAATVLIDADPQRHAAVFSKIDRDLSGNKSGVLITSIRTIENNRILIDRDWLTEEDDIPENLAGHLTKDKIRSLQGNRKTMLIRPEHKKGDKMIFAETLSPPKKLLIIGGGHIGRALCHFAGLLGFDITVVDNRPEIAKKEHFPEAQKVICGQIDKVLQDIRIGSNTYIVIVTHGHKNDAVALRQCIGRGAAYIGMIGSRRKIRLVKDDFIKNNWATKQELDEVHAPIGLDIGAESVQEIAISIAAELIEVSKTRRSSKSKKSISIVILAAGASKRMGEPKMLLPYENSTIIETVVEKALRSRADHIVVVTGSHSAEIREKLNRFAVDVIFNADHESGMLSSVQAGIRALTRDTKAVIFMLGDQPMVKTEVIDQLIDVYHNHAERIVVPVYRGKRGHPLLVELSLRHQIENLDPQKGLRQLLLDNPDEVLETEIDTPSILKDIDTKKDYINSINSGG